MAGSASAICANPSRNAGSSTASRARSPTASWSVVVGPLGLRQVDPLAHGGGVEDITAGEGRDRGRVVNAVEPKDRDIAMVFQNYALYPHMSVFDNMA